MAAGGLTMRELSIGKIRGLQRVSTTHGHFVILALDHHDALRRALNPAAPEAVTSAEMVAFKTQVVRALAPEASGVLLDPIYGAAQAIAGDCLGGAGLLLELEKADYALQPLPLLSEILPTWSVSKIKRMGADGVKLFYYYNSDDALRALQQDALLHRVAVDCAALDLPLYAEPILYPLEDEASELQQARFTERVITAAQRVEGFGADILKMEFPLHTTQWGDATAARAACAALTDATTVPWVLLSAGVDFEVFCDQLALACASGASGVIGGRAIWGEAAQIRDVSARETWLQTTGRDRMRRLAALAQTGAPWIERLKLAPVSTAWYQQYGELCP